MIIYFQESVLINLRHIAEFWIIKSFPETGGYGIPFVKSRSNDQPVHAVRMPDRQFQGCVSAVTETKDISAFNIQLLQQGSYVIGILFKTFRRISVGCTSVGLQFNC